MLCWRLIFIWSKYPLLSALDTKASNLSALSKKYRSDAKYLNIRSTYAKVAAVAVFVITLIIYVRFWWLWWWLLIKDFGGDVSDPVTVLWNTGVP